jgi:hypothetical protein
MTSPTPSGPAQPASTPLEAGTELLISNGTFLRRGDFTTRLITRGTSGGAPMAAIDWDAAITALNSSDLPCSGGERRILLLSASLAAGTPSASATPSPASTTTTPPGYSPPSGTQPENDQGTTDAADHSQFSYGS